MTRVSIIGAGVWGVALALVAKRANLKVTMWGWDHPDTHALIERRQSSRMPDVALDEEIQVTLDLKLACQSSILLLVIPAQVMRPVVEQMKKYVSGQPNLVICSKGLEQESGLLLSEVVQTMVPESVVSVLSGPTFAEEVARDLPASALIASPDIGTSQGLATCFRSPNFCLHPSIDLMGVQICGALKNVIAIAAGILSARHLGQSALAALVTHGLEEISRLGKALGAHSESFQTLAGIGDLFMTCTSRHSRNMSLGYQLGLTQGQVLDPHLLTEGAYTVDPVLKLAQKHRIEMPICTAVGKILRTGGISDPELIALVTQPNKMHSFVTRSPDGLLAYEV